MPPETIAPPPAEAPAPHHPQPIPIIIAILVLLVAAGALWFVLTRPAVDGSAPGVATSTPQASAGKQHITDNGQYYQIDAAYPGSTSLTASAGATADAHAVEVMKTFASQEIARFKDNAGLDHLTAQDIETQGLSKDRFYALQIDYKTYESPTTISYVYLLYEDTLGAHPNAYYRTFTFDKKTGDGLVLGDFFSSTADYVSVLSSESRNRLPAQIKATSDTDADMDMLNAGTTPDADNFQNFYLDGSALVLIFPPYQIAPYALGTTELRIPRSALGNALKAQYR